MMAQKPETRSLHENTQLCQMVLTVYFLNIMDTLCANFFSSCVCVYKVYKKKMFSDPRPTEWILDDLCGKWNYPARQAVTVQTHNILH